MASPRHEAGLDVVAATEAILRSDDEALAVILDHTDLRTFASMACSVLAMLLTGASTDTDELLGRFRQHFSEV